VYEDPRVTDVACQGLNGMRMGDRTLTVRRATEGQRQMAEQKQQEMYAGHTARVVKLSHAGEARAGCLRAAGGAGW
jgi:splicing factor U2AF subunit